MELFNYYDNFVIDILTNFFKDGGGAIEDYNDFFSEKFGDYANYFYPSDIDPLNQYSVLKKDKNDNYSALFSKLSDAEEMIEDSCSYLTPVLLNKVELDAIRNAISSPLASIYMNKEQIKTLQKIFDYDEGEYPDTDWDEKDIIRRFRKDIEITPELCRTIQTLIQAIIYKKTVVLTNTTLNHTVYENQLMYPLRLEFTPRLATWTLTAYSPNDNRFINMNTTRLSNVSAKEKIPDIDELEEKYTEFLQQKRKKTATIIVSAKNYMLDRFFRVFSHYNRQTKYNNKNNTYTIELEYYDFDEKPLILNLISFGPSVEVKAPASLRNKMINTIKNNLPD